MIAKAVRALWQGEQPPAERLFARLVGDLEAGDFEGETALSRLLYYFPRRPTGRVLARLEALVADGEDSRYELHRYVHRIAWCPVAKIRKRLQRLVLDTSDPTLITNGATAFADPTDPKNFDHLIRLADTMRKLDNGEMGLDHDYASRQLLLVNRETFPARRAEAVRRFLVDASRFAQVSCALACYQIDRPPARELIPLLESQAPGDDEYLIAGDGVVEEP